MNTSLRELQQWMRWIVTDPRGVDAALLEPHPQIEHPLIHRLTEPVTSRLGMIDETGTLKQNQRLSIYAEAYFLRLLECLSEDFALVLKIVGFDRFREFVIDYLMAHPSRSTTVAEVGRNLPSAIRTHSVAGDWPWVVETAEFEWLKIESFYSPVLEAMNVADFAEKSEEQWANARFVLDPSLRLQDYRFPIDTLWNARGLAADFCDLEMEPVSLLLLRDRGECVVTRLAPEQKVTLLAMQTGKTLGEILATVQADSGTVMQEFSQWLGAGVIKQIVF